MATTFYMSGVTLIVQYLTNLGLMAAGGTLNTYVAGSVNTPVTTYTDSTGIAANANPMTLNAAGRPVTPSGAITAFWVPGGTAVKLVVTDAAGNLLVQIDNIPAINDLTNSNNALAALLASAASSNAGGSGPVAGVDLVANAVKSYDVFADVRAANSPVLVTGQTLNIEVQGAAAVGDNLGGFFYWAPNSAAVDDGRTVLKPTSVSGNGRWLRYYPLGVPQVLVQTLDQQVVSSTALVNNTALSGTSLPVGVYAVSLRSAFRGSGGTGQGWQLQFTFTGVVVTGGTAGSGVTSSNGAGAATYCALGSPITGAALSNGNGDACNIDMVLNVTTAGVLNIQFAQNSSSVNPTLMKAGNMLTVTRIG